MFANVTDHHINMGNRQPSEPAAAAKPAAATGTASSRASPTGAPPGTAGLGMSLADFHARHSGASTPVTPVAGAGPLDRGYSPLGLVGATFPHAPASASGAAPMHQQQQQQQQRPQQQQHAIGRRGGAAPRSGQAAAQQRGGASRSPIGGHAFVPVDHQSQQDEQRQRQAAVQRDVHAAHLRAHGSAAACPCDDCGSNRFRDLLFHSAARGGALPPAQAADAAPMVVDGKVLPDTRDGAPSVSHLASPVDPVHVLPRSHSMMFASFATSDAGPRAALTPITAAAPDFAASASYGSVAGGERVLARQHSGSLAAAFDASDALGGSFRPGELSYAGPGAAAMGAAGATGATTKRQTSPLAEAFLGDHSAAGRKSPVAAPSAPASPAVAVAVPAAFGSQSAINSSASAAVSTSTVSANASGGSANAVANARHNKRGAAPSSAAAAAAAVVPAPPRMSPAEEEAQRLLPVDDIDTELAARMPLTQVAAAVPAAAVPEHLIIAPAPRSRAAAGTTASALTSPARDEQAQASSASAPHELSPHAAPFRAGGDASWSHMAPAAGDASWSHSMPAACDAYDASPEADVALEERFAAEYGLTPMHAMTDAAMAAAVLMHAPADQTAAASSADIAATLGQFSSHAAVAAAAAAMFAQGMPAMQAQQMAAVAAAAAASNGPSSAFAPHHYPAQQMYGGAAAWQTPPQQQQQRARRGGGGGGLYPRSHPNQQAFSDYDSMARSRGGYAGSAPMSDGMSGGGSPASAMHAARAVDQRMRPDFPGPKHFHEVELSQNRRQHIEARVPLSNGDHVLIFDDRGVDMATVVGVAPPPAPNQRYECVFLDLASAEQVAMWQAQEADAMAAVATCQRACDSLGIPMQIVAASLQFAKQKLTFFYAPLGSPHARVDFRAALPLLYKDFKARIWFQAMPPPPARVTAIATA
jgi:hypothetical protein